MRQTVFGRSLALITALVLAIPAIAQDSAGVTGADRPRVGLVLGGGGARGAAHIGVLRELERHRVPIDAIAGTSMGAIIGGLYASGVSSDELAELLVTVDWSDLLRDKPARQDLSFRRKEDDARYLLDLELGLKRGRLAWPSGLISGQKLFFMLQSLTLGVAEVEEFDALPIPFRAIATDVNSGEMVVLQSGNVATAMRASMAIPSVFSAVELDDRLLVDGGLVNNVPVDVVRRMGADIVIAVDLGAPLEEREVGSFLQIYQQTMRMLTRRNMEPQLAAADLVLVPAVSGYGTLQFKEIEEIIRLGAEETRARARELERFSLPQEDFDRRVAARRLPHRPAPRVGAVRFEGNQRVDDRIIQNQLRLRPGEPLELEALADDLGGVFGLGDFKQVDFYLAAGEQGRDVVIRAQEKPWGPNYLHFGVSIQSDLDGETELGLLANLTATRLNRRGAEWRNDLLLGEQRRLVSELYQPLDFKGRWFVAPSVDLERNRPELFVDGRKVADLSVRQSTVALDLGYQFSKFAELRLGVERGSASINVDSGELPAELVGDIELDDIDLGALVFEARSDRLDSISFPRKGSRSRLAARLSRDGLGADDEYEKLELSAGRFESFGRGTLFGSLDLGWSGDGGLPEYAVFRLGGFLSLSGFAEGELRGQYLGVARAGYFRQLSRTFFLGGWLEAGNVWQREAEAGLDELIFTATLFVGVDTLVGPVYVALGQAEAGDNKVYVSLGRTL